MCKHCYRQVKRDFYKSEGAHHKLVRISEFASNIGGLGLLSYNQQMRHRFNHKKNIFAVECSIVEYIPGSIYGHICAKCLVDNDI